jgi:hypothetical protein
MRALLHVAVTTRTRDRSVSTLERERELLMRAGRQTRWRKRNVIMARGARPGTGARVAARMHVAMTRSARHRSDPEDDVSGTDRCRRFHRRHQALPRMAGCTVRHRVAPAEREARARMLSRGERARRPRRHSMTRTATAAIGTVRKLIAMGRRMARRA